MAQGRLGNKLNAFVAPYTLDLVKVCEELGAPFGVLQANILRAALHRGLPEVYAALKVHGTVDEGEVSVIEIMKNVYASGWSSATSPVPVAPAASTKPTAGKPTAPAKTASKPPAAKVAKKASARTAPPAKKAPARLADRALARKAMPKRPTKATRAAGGKPTLASAASQ